MSGIRYFLDTNYVIDFLQNRNDEVIKQLESDGLEIEQDNSKLKNVKLTDEYISKNWRKLIITHEYPFIEDKEKLVDAHGEWYKKYIS